MRKDTLNIFAVVSPGLENVCARELAGLGMVEIRIVTGGVEFAGTLRDLYRANLWLRSASRILVRIGEVKCRDFPALFRKALRLPWGRFIRPSTRLRVRASSKTSRLHHTGRIAATVADACDHALGRQEPSDDGPEQLILARFENDSCVLSVDSSGELLHRRGYRLQGGHAPLRETLAAGILLHLGWAGSSPLVDPMCGSGTFPVEGALLACNRPPGRHRLFGFMDWPRYRPGLWQALLVEADGVARPLPVAVRGFDRSEEVVAVARTNAERAALDGLEFRPVELSRLPVFSGRGLVFCNPPYGARLESGRDLRPLYREISSAFRQHFSGWQGALLSPDESLVRASEMPWREVCILDNGGIKVGLYTVNL